MSHKHDILKKDTVVATTTKETTIVSQAAALKETRVHDTAVKEIIKPIQTEEIQPVIHRDIYTTEIHQQKQPVFQKEVLPTRVEEHVLPTQNLREVNKGSSGAHFTMDHEKSTKVVQDTTHTKIVKPAIIEEVIHPQVITEVQPVIYREVVQPTLIKEVQNINEKIVERPVIITETDALPATTSARPLRTSHEHVAVVHEHEHTSLKDKLKHLFHAPSGVDTVTPLHSTTTLDSGSILTTASPIPFLEQTTVTSTTTSAALPRTSTTL